MEFSRQEYWSGLPCPPPRDLPNPGLLHCRWILYSLSHQGSPIILERVVHPLSRGSSWPRNWIRICSLAGGFFTSWATRTALKYVWSEVKWLSRVRLFPDPMDCNPQAPLSMGFSRQEYWSGLPFPSPVMYTLQQTGGKLFYFFLCSFSFKSLITLYTKNWFYFYVLFWLKDEYTQNVILEKEMAAHSSINCSVVDILCLKTKYLIIIFSSFIKI